MQIFQFYFNPKLKEDLIFDSFCFEPENIYEKRLGSLYIVGILKSALPKDRDFLKKVFAFVKDKFYKNTSSRPELALKNALRETNEFLREMARNRSSPWLGNLSFLVLNLQNFLLNFAKMGEIKIFLKRGKKLIDLDKKLKLRDIDSYPLGLFGKVAVGRLIENDLVFALTKEVFDFFQKENLLETLKDLSFFNEKDFKKILNEKKESLAQVAGIAIFLYLSKEFSREKKEVIAPKVFKEFSPKDLFSPFLKRETKELKPFSFSEMFSPLRETVLTSLKNKKFLLVFLFVLVLILGYFLFH